MSETKRFALRTILTVTTGRLLTEPKGPRDNGIGDLHEILGWMTNDSPFTHQLGRFAEECKPWLLRWFPEVARCGTEAELASLDHWLKCDQTGGQEGIKMWLAEQRMKSTAIREEYDVPKIPPDDHERTHPYDELVAMRGTDEGIHIVGNPEPQ